MAFKRIVPGIFSREHSDLYRWLVEFLLSISVVADVRQVLISNNFFDFQKETDKCDFAILYHSKTRGRLNVTDVIDSLYDDELKHLNRIHGKKKVLVVIDDVEDSSDHVKTELLDSQPSIRSLAEDLLVFSAEEKAQLSRSGTSGYQGQPDLTSKLNLMKSIIEGSSSRNQEPSNWPGAGDTFQQGRQLCRPRCLVLIAVIAVLVILLIVLPITLRL